MLVTIALVVLCSSIVVFFSEEFISLFKKMLAIPGVKLLLPLVIASLFVEMYESWGLWVLARCQAALHQVIYLLSRLVPFETGSVSLMRIVYLFIIASLPVWCFLLKSRLQGRRYPVHPFTYHLGLVLWVMAVILLSVPS